MGTVQTTLPPRILIAEDNDLQSSVLRSVLEGRGYMADIVTDGMEAVRRLRTGRYDLALLDYHMPEVDGLAAARLVRDFLGETKRPRLIGVTVAAQELSAKEEGYGGGFFDNVVSKGLGLPALLSAVDASLVEAAQIRAIELMDRSRTEAHTEAQTRRQRRLAPLAALPGIVMAGVFMAGIIWAIGCLQGISATQGSAEQAQRLTTNAALLVGAVQDSEASERAYRSSGVEKYHERFLADAQRVDRLLTSPASLSLDGASGFGDEIAAPAMIQTRMKDLADRVQTRAESPAGVDPTEPAGDGGRDAATRLRDWATSLVMMSQDVVLTSLQTLKDHIEPVIAVLGVGMGYSIWNAVIAFRRRWRLPQERRVALRRADRGWQPPITALPPPILSLSNAAPVRGQYGL
jgi:CheY-like chemotaxis protein